MSTTSLSSLPVAIVGAGPVGLAAAAHLLERGLEPLLFEAGPAAGTSVRAWGHVRLFSPWRECLDPAAVRLLEATGWTSPAPETVPLGRDLVANYLEPLAALPTIQRRLHLHSRVTAIGRLHRDKVLTSGRANTPFVLHIMQADGTEHRHLAQAVIDTSGTWQTPNPAGAGGLSAVGERQHTNRVRYGIPDVLHTERTRYANRRVLVVGGGHSAANVLLDLAALRRTAPQTEILWAIRRDAPDRAYGGEDDDALAGRGALGKRLHRLVDSGTLRLLTRFNITGFVEENDAFFVQGEQADQTQQVAVDEVVVCTGFRPDLSFLREVRLSLDPALESAAALAPLIDPNVHSCGTVRPHGEQVLRHPEPGFYIAGMKSYGRAPTFLLLTGYEQVRSITAALAGDHEAASRVELCLPETGVCSAPAAPAAEKAPLISLLAEPQAAASCCS